VAEEKHSRQKYFIIFLTGIVSLVVGVLSALIANYLTQERLSLAYNVSMAEFADDSGQEVGIVSIAISNLGRKEIEDLEGTFDFGDAVITRFQHEGVPADSIQLSKEDFILDFSLPFLNKDESFFIQILVEPQGGGLAAPEIMLRGKGVTGEALGVEDSKIGNGSGAVAIVAPFFTVLAGTSMVILLRKNKGSLLSAGQQGDEFAYLLGLNGFIVEANQLRKSSRDHTYWALSDSFTERLFADSSTNPEKLMRGVTVLNQTIEYSGGMASRSKAIIQFNAARIAKQAEQLEVAAALLEKARSSHSQEVQLRLKIDSKFSETMTQP